MPKLPILAPPYKNVDEVAVQQGGVELIDGYFDEQGSLNRRWGLWSWWSAQGMPGIDGLFWWKDKQLLIVVSAGRGYAFKSLTDAPTEFTTGDVRFNVNHPVSFATSGALLFGANGNRIVQWDGVNNATLEASDLAPQECTGVAVMSNRLVAVAKDTQRVHLTESVAESDTSVTWKPTFFNANAQSDNVVQIAASWSQLILWGTYSTEFWYFTGQEATETDVPFARIEGSVIERGIVAPGSTVQANNTWYWLDHERRVVKLEGGSPKIISTPIDRILRGYARVDDCRAFLVDRWLVFTFPTADQTWVFDLITESWQRWAKWNQEIGQYEAYLGCCSAYVTEWGTLFVGGRRDGRVLITHPNLVSDIFEPIRCLYRSAHFDHGTMARKKSNRLFLRMKRGI